MSEDDIQADVMLLLATSEGARIKSYLDRGRSFQGLALSDLVRQYEASFRAWANLDGRPGPDFARHNDLAGEFYLRGLQPPLERLEPEMDRLAAAVEQRMALLSDLDREEINDDLLQEIAKAKRDRN